MSKTETVYDSTMLQIEALDNLAVGSLSIKELSKPEVVVMLLERQRVTLTELKSSKDEITDLKEKVDNLKDEQTILKVDLAKAEQRQSILLVEIPISSCKYVIS